MRSTQTSDGTLVAQVWQNIYDPTVFIVGKADDLSYHEYGVLSDSVFGADAPAQAFEDDAKLAQFTSAARQLPAPQVNSMWVWIWEDKKEATQAFRFMGQRFTLDEYVFGQMIYRNVGTDTDPRMLPKGMDFMASLGSDEALSILNTMGETQYANYSDQMTKVRKEVAGLQKDSWTQNLYWSWLYTFLPMIEKKDSRFPVFMQTEAWMRKELNTALGSWTELKHDTILYAKQVMAEMGGGGPDQAPPHGYVEPNPEVYARLLALTKMTEDGLRSRNLLTALTEGNLSNLSEQLTMLQSVSERELAGEQLSNDEYWALQYFGGVLENLTLAAADASDPSMRDLNDQKAALVADVATGADKGGGLVALEEAIGQPTLIYVIPPDQPRRIAVGGVFSYYEFTVSSGERMTDEQWQAKVESGDLPKAPDWTSQFVAP
jgi:hypothetical protein